MGLGGGGSRPNSGVTTQSQGFMNPSITTIDPTPPQLRGLQQQLAQMFQARLGGQGQMPLYGQMNPGYGNIHQQLYGQMPTMGGGPQGQIPQLPPGAGRPIPPPQRPGSLPPGWTPPHSVPNSWSGITLGQPLPTYGEMTAPSNVVSGSRLIRSYQPRYSITPYGR